MASNIPASDLELMQRIAENDSKALEILYNRYSPLLYSLIKKIITDEKIAGEILADVFLIIWKKINYFDFETKNVYTWIVTLTRNKTVDVLRRMRNPDGYELYSDDYEIRSILPPLSSIIDPLDIKTVSSIKDSVQSAINRLTDAQQYVIQLAFYEGLSEQEIAKQLKIPLPTVKSKITIALTNFKDYLIRGEE